MSISREDLLAAAEDDCDETFLAFIAKHVSTQSNVFVCICYSTIQYNKNLYSAYSHRVSRALRRRELINNVQKGRF